MKSPCVERLETALPVANSVKGPRPERLETARLVTTAVWNTIDK